MVDKESIDFLDVTIFKGPTFNNVGTLDSKVYFKPTDSHQLLHKQSFHPKHTFRGIIKSQIIRFHRICTNKSDFEQACTTLFKALRHRGYTHRYLRYIKSKTLMELNPLDEISRGCHPCGEQKCKTCPFMTTSQTIKNSKGRSIEIKHKMTCQTPSVIYVIECKSCKIKYVGQTSTSIHERLVHHRSDINTKKTTPVADHFNNNSCGGISSLTITPVEIVPRNSPVDLIRMKELLFRMEREQHWIAKLNTLAPHGLNKKKELPPPLPFIPQYSDQAGKLTEMAKTSFSKIKQMLPGPFFRTRFLGTNSRNKNLKDILVQTNLKD